VLERLPTRTSSSYTALARPRTQHLRRVDDPTGQEQLARGGQPDDLGSSQVLAMPAAMPSWANGIVNFAAARRSGCRRTAPARRQPHRGAVDGRRWTARRGPRSDSQVV
jgi:hypothetical protein